MKVINIAAKEDEKKLKDKQDIQKRFLENKVFNINGRSTRIRTFKEYFVEIK